jgi:antitoxin ParD1/3/4
MATTITFRPTPDDERIIERARHGSENTTDVIRRALRLLDREAWLEQFRIDAAELADEDLNAEEDAW